MKTKMNGLLILFLLLLINTIMAQYIASLKGNKVEVRGYTLKYIAAQFYSNLKKISASGDNVVLYYDNGKVEVRDMNLKYISARFQ
jgi:hypothetical protein